MSDRYTNHGLFFRWGRLHLGVAGIPALTTLAFVVVVILVGRMWQAW